jgi:hypothetical protein
MTQWISIDDRLPTADDCREHDDWLWVLIWSPSYGYEINGCTFIEDVIEWLRDEHATHWATPLDPPSY